MENTNRSKEKKHKTSNSLYIDMGKRLRITRIKLNYTQEQMAEILDMSTAYYGKVERGIHGLSLEKLVLVNTKLDIDINFLLTGIRQSIFSKDQIIKECPREKRYDLEQLIICAIRLSKNEKR